MEPVNHRFHELFAQLGLAMLLPASSDLLRHTRLWQRE